MARGIHLETFIPGRSMCGLNTQNNRKIQLVSTLRDCTCRNCAQTSMELMEHFIAFNSEIKFTVNYVHSAGTPIMPFGKLGRGFNENQRP